MSRPTRVIVIVVVFGGSLGSSSWLPSQDGSWTDRLGLRFTDDCQEEVGLAGLLSWLLAWVTRGGQQRSGHCESREMRCAVGQKLTGLQVRYARLERGDRDLYDFRPRCGTAWQAWLGLRFPDAGADHMQSEAAICHDAGASVTGVQVMRGRNDRRDQDYYAYQTARAEYQRAQQEVAVSRSQAENAHVGFLNGVQVPLPPPAVMRSRVKVAENQLARARADLEEEKVRVRDLRVPSPIGGVVNKTLVDQGEYVSAGQPLLMMHDPDDLWVEANIKETDIGELRPGQPVAITVDAYPDEHFAGEVRIVGRAATSQFALLPDPNPSGNFTKITQRIPVRIRLTEGPVERIGPGMMVEVDIDVSGG